MADEGTIGPKIEIEGLDEAVAALTKLGEAGEKSFDQIANAAEKINHAGEGIDQLTQKGEEGFQHLAEVGAEAFSRIMEAALNGNIAPAVTLMFGEMAGAIAQITEKAIEFVEAQASMVETLSNLAEATGSTIAQIEGLKDAFASVGISTNGFERSIGRLAITIGNEWSQIQQAVRTSADEQASAMLHVTTTAFEVEKAYTAMNMALTSASQSAKHDALGIEEASISLQRAVSALSSASLEARSSALGVESAKLALIRAQMNLAKDQGQQVNPADEKALKIEQDKLAVKDAQLRIEEAQKKQQEQGLDLQAKQLAVKKAQMEVDDAAQKRADDAVKNAERIRDAQLNIQKAQLAAREAQEKAHEQDLKDIPKIAQEVENVANGYKKWDDVMNHAEISAQNLTKAVLLAAAGGSKEPPKALDVFKEMSKLFENMGDSSDAMNKKLEIVQHTMGAGFRAGQASAAQLLAVLQRGPEALQKFMDEAEKFSKVKIGGFNLDEANKSASNAVTVLKEFNSASAQLEAAIDQIKNRFAAMMAAPLAKWFEQAKESIYDTHGALRLIAETAGNLFEIIMHLVEGFVDGFKSIFAAVNQVVQSISKLFGLDPAVVVAAMAASFVVLSTALEGVAAKLALVMGKMFAWVAIVGLVTTAVGDLVKAWALLPAWMGGGKGTFDEGSKIEAMGQAITRAAAKMAGFTDKQLDTAGDKSGLAKGIFGNSEDLKKLGAAADKTNEAGDKLTQSGDKLTSAGDKHGEAASKLSDAGTQIAANMTSASDKLTGAGSSLNGAADALKSAAANLASALSKVAGAKAGGGYITGPGGPTDDRAGLFALSDGEYVVRSAAVSHYGAPLFEALNNLAVGGFATGGLVSGSAPRAPSVPASSAQSSAVLNLSIDGHQFNGLRAPENVASKLKTFAVTRQTASAGRKPSWMQ